MEGQSDMCKQAATQSHFTMVRCMLARIFIGMIPQSVEGTGVLKIIMYTHTHTHPQCIALQSGSVSKRAQVEYEGKHPDGKHAAVFARSYIPFAEK